MHVLLVCDATTLYPCVLQYPAGSKMRSACAWVYTFRTHGVVVEAGGGGVVGFAGTPVWVYILREIPFLNITPEVGFAGLEIPLLNIRPELGFAGGVTTLWYCCILSKRVVDAASCASMFDMSVLSLVAELAMLFSAVAMASLVICVSVTLLTAPKEFGLARNRWRRSTLASRYLVCHDAHICNAGGNCSHSQVASG